jgi:hypothetical protein
VADEMTPMPMREDEQPQQQQRHGKRDHDG